MALSFLSDAFREFKKTIRLAGAEKELRARFSRYRADAARPHGLAGGLIVSLTSYPKRYPVLPLTLMSILSQSMRPDRVILWLASEDIGALTPEILSLKEHGLEIRETDNLRSFTKIIPTLRAFPDVHILTMDDDVYYPADIIETLIAALKTTPDTIVCHRAHDIRLGADGRPQPYRRWVRNTGNNHIAPLLFPTGVMGVLYPPGVFHADTTDETLFMRLCPTADDVWLYWMWRMTGHQARKIGKPCRVLEWRESQHSRLQSANISDGGNDECVTAMTEHYGFPAS